ncbi:MAG: phosphoribosylglycinamide formyltransferase [Gammaproteobacteria bacterium]|nr:phosphoribosylglycinamide formyltransferase [Gammaproteobacteria bacterium]
MKTLSLVVLISGSGSNLQAIIDAIESKQLNAQISAVISNRPDAYGLTRARQHDIPAISLDHKHYQNRELFDQQLQLEIESFKPDIIVLAGYMRILTTAFINAFSPTILNIHPSLLPKYQGLNTHQRALDNNDSEHGVSIHVVTPELDSGPVIVQGKFSIEKEDNSESLQQKAHKLEHQMYPLVLNWLSKQRLKLNSDMPLFDEKPVLTPLLFEATVDAG